MRADDILIVGDKVDLIREEGRVYRTMIEDATGNGLYLTGAPSYGGIPVFLHPGDDVRLVFYRDSGRYIAYMKVVGLEKRGEVRYAWLFQKTRAHKEQRREAFRLPVGVKALVCEYESGMEKRVGDHGEDMDAVTLEATKSVDISITGMAFSTRREYAPGEKYLLKVFFDDERGKTPSFIRCSEVVRKTKERGAGRYNIGMRFFGQSQRQSEFIARYIFNQQQKQLIRRRIAERR